MGSDIKDLSVLELCRKLREKTVILSSCNPEKLPPIDISVFLTKAVQANRLHLGKRRHTFFS